MSFLAPTAQHFLVSKQSVPTIVKTGGLTLQQSLYAPSLNKLPKTN